MEIFEVIDSIAEDEPEKTGGSWGGKYSSPDGRRGFMEQPTEADLVHERKVQKETDEYLLKKVAEKEHERQDARWNNFIER